MDSPNFLSIKVLVNDIVLLLTGLNNNNSSIIKVNVERLSSQGELYFLTNIKVWKDFFQNTSCCTKNCANILQHFFNRETSEIAKTDILTQIEIVNEALKSLILLSKAWKIHLENYTLRNEKVCLHLNRKHIIPIAIKTTLQGQNFGYQASREVSYALKVQEDEQSELTNVRLHLLRDVTSKILVLKGFQVSEKNSTHKIIFTTKSEGNAEENYEKYVCGVAKNIDSNTKDICSTWNIYIEKKVDQLVELNQFKIETFKEESNDLTSFLFNMAKSIATFELLSVKPSRPIVCGTNVSPDKITTNTKGASFILYNVARITAILEKYQQKESNSENYTLPDIDSIDFSELDGEDEWNLIYNYILKYQDTIEESIEHDSKFESNPQIICFFLSRLCQKFSVYYRQTRILTEDRAHLLPKMFARIYMLRALQSVLKSALAILGITAVSRM